MGLIQAIGNDNLKKQMAKKLKPFLVKAKNGTLPADLSSLFEVSSKDDFEIDDSKGDVSITSASKRSDVDKRSRSVFFCRGIIIREDNHYFLAFAYLTEKSELPWWSPSAFATSSEQLEEIKEALMALAVHRLHVELVNCAPDILRVVRSPMRQLVSRAGVC